MRGWVLVLALGACSFDHGVAPSPNGPDAGSGSGIEPDGAVMPDAPFATGPFGEPTLVPISMGGVRDDDITLTGDMLEIFFESDRVAAGQSDIYTARRAHVTDAWSLPERVDELSTAFLETSMEVSVDGLTLYFSSNRPPSMTVDVFVATRPDRASPWNPPVLVSSLSTSTANDYNAQPWGDTVIYLGSDRMPARGGSDIFRATRANATSTWSEPADVPGLDTNKYEGEAFVDATGAVWFTGDMAGDDDLYRADPDGSGGFKAPQLVPDINTPYAENDAWLSPDGHTLYFTSTRNGSLDIYMATR